MRYNDDPYPILFYKRRHGVLHATIEQISTENLLSLNLTKSRLPLAPIFVDKSFENFVQNTSYNSKIPMQISE